jgi:hypothetical protein
LLSKQLILTIWTIVVFQTTVIVYNLKPATFYHAKMFYFRKIFL